MVWLLAAATLSSAPGQAAARASLHRASRAQRQPSPAGTDRTRASHPRPRRVQVFLTEHYLGIAMEYANGGDSFEYVRKKGGLHENEARWFFQQLIVALDYCHRKGVINRDVKLENTLIHWARKPLLKICDFGYSKDMKYQSAPASRVGTPAYLAPEVRLRRAL
jgi:serine/threonine-protein kinase SRK2